MSTDRDDAPARRYREASAALDERPSASTRAAILAAAARQVEARPRPADAPRIVRRPRWPLAAAAAVLLSTLAVMMANRTEQEMPSFTAPTERAPEAAAIAPAPSAAASSSDSAVPLPAPPIAQTPVPIAKRSTTSNAREERSSATAAPKERPDVQGSDAASPAVSARSVERAAEGASAEALQDLPAAPPRAAPLARSAPAPAAQGAARLDTARDFERSAPMWLERIVKLRTEGREAEADAELKRFRERYPDVQVPSAALPGGAAAGTR